MSTYLLKWNPKKWEWTDFPQRIEEVLQRGFFDARWSCGNTKTIKRGSRVFLLRTGIAPRGVVASGTVTAEPYEDDHYDPNRRDKTALYVMVRFDSLLHPDNHGILALEKLPSGPLADYFERTQRAVASGIKLPPEAAAELESAWSAFLTARAGTPALLAEEVAIPTLLVEGATRLISINAYERNAHARDQCIQHYGCRCSVCGFDFKAFYGEVGRNFIHVHHLTPLAQIRAEYEVDPIADLRPVCPNCHAMIHRKTSTMTIEQLRGEIQRCRTSPTMMDIPPVDRVCGENPD